MTAWDIRKEYLHNLSSSVMSDFTRLMDTLPNTEWVRFASRVLSDQTDMKLAERRERRTDWVMNRWMMRNGTVGELLVILEDQQLYRPRDIILNWRPTGQLHPPCFTPGPSMPAPYSGDVYSRFTPPPKTTHHETQSTTFLPADPGLKLLPTPGPPPRELESQIVPLKHPEPVVPDSLGLFNAMCWPFEEVQNGTNNFSTALLIGEGGFGHVYRASMRNTDYAVKKLKEDSQIEWNTVKDSFKTEVEKLSQYRHKNIVELMGYSIGKGTYCLLYSFMPCGSLEDQLHNTDNAALSWPQRVNVMLGSAKAVQFLHSCTPVLIHGDIKSSNILLGEHLEAKLGDFGLARFCRAPSRSAGKTTTVARTKTVRGTLAYLPDEFVKNGELGTGIDIYSFGVVLLEVLTGRRALEVDGQTKAIYLKDLVLDVEDDRSLTKGKSSLEPSIPKAATHICKNHLDPKLQAQSVPCPRVGPGSVASLEPAGLHGCLDLAALASCCLEPRKKRRPPMTEVFQKLQDIHTLFETVSSGASSSHHLSCPRAQPSLPKPPYSSDSFTWASTVDQFKPGPLEDTYDCQPAPASRRPPSFSTVSSSTVSSTTVPSSTTSSLTASSFLGPCESDESQGYTQYTIPSRQPTTTSSSSSSLGCGAFGGQGVESTGCSSQAGSLRCSTAGLIGVPNREVVINPCKERFLHKMELYKEGTIHTDELLSFHNLYVGTDPPHQGPEESDELAYLHGEASESPSNTSH